MLMDLVLPGEKVELQTVERSILGAASGKKAYTSKVYDVLSDEQIEIAMPMEKTKLILLPIDGEYDVCFYTEKGLYQCDVKIIDRYKSNNIYMLLCELTSNLRKYQRREFYRFSCVLNMSSRELVEEEIAAVEKDKLVFQPGLPLKKSVIADISGGGIRFVSSYQYEVDTLIYLTYTLILNRKEKIYEIVGQILSSKELANRPGEFEHRVKYINIGKADQEEIIRYIFEEERRNRQNRNGR